MSALTDAVALLRLRLEQEREERAAWEARLVVLDAVEQAGDVPGVIAALEEDVGALREEIERLGDQRDLLRIEIETLRKERARAGGPGEEAQG